MLAKFGGLAGAAQSTDWMAAKMQGDIQKDAQQAQNVIENNGGDTFDIDVPVQIYPLQKLDAKEIEKLTAKISDYTIKDLDGVFALRGKRSFRQ